METLPEHKVVSQVTARVLQRVPEATTESVDNEVADLFRKYADSKVRVFLPILVEREAVNHLRTTTSAVA